MSFILQSTRRGSPALSWEIEDPRVWWTASWVWKGPRTVPWVEDGGLGCDMLSTSRLRPRVSDRRTNSCTNSIH